MNTEQVGFGRFLTGAAVRLKGLYLSTMAVWSTIYGVPLIIGALIAAMLDHAAHPPVTAATWWLLGAAVALMVLRAVALWVGLQLTFVLIFRTSAWIKTEVLGRLLGRPTALGPARGSGEILNRLRDDSDEIGGLLEWTTDLIYRSVLLVIAVAVLATADLVMTIPLVLLAGGLVASVMLKKRVAATQAETRVRQGMISAEITDTLTGVRDLRLAGAMTGRLAGLHRRFAWRRTVQLRHQIYLDLLSDLFYNLVMVGTGVVLLTVSLSVARGDFSAGKLVLFLTYASWLGQQMYFFGKILARYQSGRVSYRRLAELAGDDPTGPDTNDVRPLRELTVTDLTCAAPAGATAPRPVTFQVRPGQLVVITGELGSGKSLVVRSLLGLQPGTTGSIRWNGAEVVGDQSRLGAPRVGYARQQAKFVHGSLLDNLTLGSDDVTPARVEAAMAAVCLRPGSEELPRGLATWIDSGTAGQLSGGQRQRLSLARMLCRPADVYVVDDCDSSLDGPTARAIWATLPRQWPAAWIVVSRNEDLLAAADVVVNVTRATVDAGALSL